MHVSTARRTWKVPSQSRIATMADATSVRDALAAATSSPLEAAHGAPAPARVAPAAPAARQAVLLGAGAPPPRARTGRRQGSQRPMTARMAMVTWGRRKGVREGVGGMGERA
jgi:hypothetical protein